MSTSLNDSLNSISTKFSNTLDDNNKINNEIKLKIESINQYNVENCENNKAIKKQMKSLCIVIIINCLISLILLILYFV